MVTQNSKQMKLVEQELACNALTAKVHFGGGNRGCLCVVYTAIKYHTETGVNGTVPATQRAYPTFVANDTNDKKKLAILEFIRDAHGIRVMDTVQELLKTTSLKRSTEIAPLN